METATFFCDHGPSNSRAVVEFGRIERKVVLIAVGFIKGKVVDINLVRDCHKQAKQILLYGGYDWLPPRNAG